MSSESVKLAEVEAVANGNSALSAALQRVITKPGDNLIFSPFSLSAVMAMVKLGARGDTDKEIQKVLNFPPDNKTLSTGYSKVLASMKETTDGYILAAANRLYTQQGFELKKDFSSSVQSSFGAAIQQLDFGKSAAAAAEINKWVEEITNNKIKDLISPSDLDPLTKVVLVNGVYFKGQWRNKFDENSTKKAPFRINEKEAVECDLMFKHASVLYADLPDLNARVAALPYKGDRMCMMIYLPKEVNGLAKIEANLQTLAPPTILSKLGSHDVHVYLPKFKVESTHQLSEPLKSLGAKAMFDDRLADFSGIPETKIQLYVSAIIQKAFIEVNEEGCEAAAATAVMVMTPLSYTPPPPPPIQFKANRPFYFQIVDRQTNFILFAGICRKPTSSKASFLYSSDSETAQNNPILTPIRPPSAQRPPLQPPPIQPPPAPLTPKK